MIHTCRICGRLATKHDANTEGFRCGTCRVRDWRNYNRQPTPPPDPCQDRSCADCGKTEPKPVNQPKKPPAGPWVCNACYQRRRRGQAVPGQHTQGGPSAGSCPERARRIAALMLTEQGAERIQQLCQHKRAQ